MGAKGFSVIRGRDLKAAQVMSGTRQHSVVSGGSNKLMLASGKYSRITSVRNYQKFSCPNLYAYCATSTSNENFNEHNNFLRLKFNLIA